MKKRILPPFLRWACRRGMLELDVILNQFVAQNYGSLSAKEQEDFYTLLQCQDQDIFRWLFGTELPQEEGLIQLIIQIRQHAQLRV